MAMMNCTSHWTGAHVAKVEVVQVFVPVEDAPLDPQALMLVPYRCGVPCEHAWRKPDWSPGEPVRRRADETNAHAMADGGLPQRP